MRNFNPLFTGLTKKIGINLKKKKTSRTARFERVMIARSQTESYR